MTATLPLLQRAGFGPRRGRIRPSEAVVAVARRLWPSKTAPNLAARAEVGTRAAELWLEGRAAPSAEALVNLLRSDAGFELLSAMLDGSGTRWWRDFQRGVQIADLERRADENRAAIAALVAGGTR